MRVFFTVQGEGRGHLTQALALRAMLARRGHEVVGVVLGHNGQRPAPGYFAEGIGAPVWVQRSPGFVFKGARGVCAGATLYEVGLGLPTYLRSLWQLRRRLRQCQPDVVVNFLEPLLGLHNACFGARVPTVVVGHQYLLEHPVFPRVAEFPASRRIMRGYLQVVGARSARLALSFYPAPPLPERRLTVCPPLLRAQLFEQEVTRGNYLLVYLLNHGYAEAIRKWHERHPHVPIHCFYDKPGAPDEEQATPNLCFHRLNGEKFLRLMAGCRAVVTTAGFETVCEAAWLRKPLLMVPVENHVEQYLNACDAEQAGLGMRDRTFQLSRLLAPDCPVAPAGFREWVARGASVAVTAVETWAMHDCPLELPAEARPLADGVAL
jgi:uncharacterized protein (TIGR00661 family)